VITGDTLAFRHSIKPYTVVANPGSVFHWIISGDSSHSINTNLATISWGPSAGGIVSVSEENGSGCISDTAHLSVRVIPKTSVDELYLMNQLLVYPNPASDQLKLSGALEKIGTIRLYSTEGKEIETIGYPDFRNGTINTSNLVNGMYLLMIESVNHEISVRKISIQNEH
jgi:hypothetical protein